MAKAASWAPKSNRPKEAAHTDDGSVSSAERYALVAEAVTEGIYDWNVGDNTLYLSVRLYAILGLTSSSLSAGDWNEHIHPDDFPAYRAALSRHFKGETERFDCEYRMRRGSGDFIWIADRGTCMRGEDSRAMRMVGAKANDACENGPISQSWATLSPLVPNGSGQAPSVVNPQPAGRSPVAWSR